MRRASRGPASRGAWAHGSTPAAVHFVRRQQPRGTKAWPAGYQKTGKRGTFSSSMAGRLVHYHLFSYNTPQQTPEAPLASALNKKHIVRFFFFLLFGRSHIGALATVL